MMWHDVSVVCRRLCMYVYVCMYDAVDLSCLSETAMQMRPHRMKMGTSPRKWSVQGVAGVAGACCWCW